MTANGGPAFPSEVNPNPFNPQFNPGMSLRDWFAGQALAGILADETFDAVPERIAATVYGIADAMLKAREARDA